MDANGKCALYTGCAIIISGLRDSRVSSDWPFEAGITLTIDSHHAHYRFPPPRFPHPVASRCIAFHRSVDDPIATVVARARARQSPLVNNNAMRAIAARNSPHYVYRVTASLFTMRMQFSRFELAVCAR